MRVRIKGELMSSLRDGGSPYYVVVREDVRDQEVFAYINEFWFVGGTPEDGDIRTLCPNLPLNKIRWKVRTQSGVVDYHDTRWSDMRSVF